MEASTSGRIALFLPSLTAGGAERVTLNLAGGIVGRGVQADLVLAGASGEFLGAVPAGVRVIDLGQKRTLTSLPGLVRYLRAERPAVLISAIDHSNVVALWAKLLAGGHTKTVVTLHTNFTHAQKNSKRRTLKSRMIHFCMRKSYPLADALVAVSRGVADDFASFFKISRQRVRVIYNPVISPDFFARAAEPLEHPWFSPGDPPVVVAIGRLSDQKDYPTLLGAFARVLKERAARLLILGEGEGRSEVEKRVAQLGLRDAVGMPGFVSNPYPYLRKAALLVLSSRAEGLPTVLVEALALGVPIVSSDCESGPAEILEGGRLGRLVPVGDEERMAQEIIFTLDNAVAIRQEVQQWQERGSRYTLEHAVAQYLEIFPEALTL